MWNVPSSVAAEVVLVSNLGRSSRLDPQSENMTMHWLVATGREVGQESPLSAPPSLLIYCHTSRTGWGSICSVITGVLLKGARGCNSRNVKHITEDRAVIGVSHGDHHSDIHSGEEVVYQTI